MNILLVGGSCSLINSMILKLRKEGHRIFLLTGDKYRHNKYERVFEKYEFSYDCENLNDILESVNADVTILMGAFDTNYRWNGEEREIVLFISQVGNFRFHPAVRGTSKYKNTGNQESCKAFLRNHYFLPPEDKRDVHLFFYLH